LPKKGGRPPKPREGGDNKKFRRSESKITRPSGWGGVKSEKKVGPRGGNQIRLGGGWDPVHAQQKHSPPMGASQWLMVGLKKFPNPGKGPNPHPTP